MVFEGMKNWLKLVMHHQGWRIGQKSTVFFNNICGKIGPHHPVQLTLPLKHMSQLFNNDSQGLDTTGDDRVWWMIWGVSMSFEKINNTVTWFTDTFSAEGSFEADSEVGGGDGTQGAIARIGGSMAREADVAFVIVISEGFASALAFVSTIPSVGL